MSRNSDFPLGNTDQYAAFRRENDKSKISAMVWRDFKLVHEIGIWDEGYRTFKHTGEYSEHGQKIFDRVTFQIEVDIAELRSRLNLKKGTF